MFKFLNENVWYTEQNYENNAAILDTLFENSDFGLRIYQRDFADWITDYLTKYSAGVI